MKVLFRAAVIIVAGAAALTAADAAYVGKWKLNPAKSNFGETTVTFEQAPGGGFKLTSSGQSFTFNTDGKDYPTPFGTVDVWKSQDAYTWEETTKTNGKVTSTTRWKLSPDGKSLTADSKNIKADGQTSNDSQTFQRVSGSSGLAGKWKTMNVKIGSPGTVTIAANGADGVTLTFVEEKGTCAPKFDGKDSPATGPIWPSGWSCTVAKSGANALDVTWKKDGKVMSKDLFTPSADGKTLTDDGTVPGLSEKTKAVYERQ
jgi:hypothetical protein